MNFADAIGTADLEPGDVEPRGCCLDCGADLPTAETRCEACEQKREEFAVNGGDPRRPVRPRWGTSRERPSP